jgi:plasmid stabilization system protein ParE
MNYQYVYDPAAFKEYKNSIRWYQKRSDLAAENFIKETTNCIRSICTNPARYRNTYKTFHEAPLKRFPFSIVYFVDEEKQTIVIVSVYHHKRDPRRKFKE